MRAALGLALLLVGCADEAAPSATGGEAAAPPVEAPPPSAAPAPALPRVPANPSDRFAASHVLVMYQGAVGALPTVTRSKDEARARAEEVRATLLAGEAFPEVAKAYSDDSTGPRGGSLGGFGRGTMVAPFETAVEGLAVGALSGVVESPFGFHVIRRDPIVEIHVQHLFVAWAGAELAPPGTRRTKEEARARAEEARARVAGGEAWAEVVRGYSDGPMKDDAGDLGWLAKGQLAEALDTPAFDLDIGATTAVVETPRGFHLVHRVE